jgi:hypothetical protein
VEKQANGADILQRQNTDNSPSRLVFGLFAMTERPLLLFSRFETHSYRQTLEKIKIDDFKHGE